MGSNRRQARALARAAAVLAVALVGVLLASPPGVVGSRSASLGPAFLPGVAVAGVPFAPGKCGGGSVDPNITGTLAVDGGPYPPPSVANRTIEVGFDYLQNLSIHGGPPSFQCLARNVTATTGAGGGFSADMTLPGGSGCGTGSGSNCVYFTGPFAPVTLGVAGAPPAGYFVTSSLLGTTASVAFVAALNSATLNPFGRTTVSVGARVTLVAQGLAGNGAASPATLSYAWTLSGSDWTPAGGAGTSAFEVASSPGATLGTVTVYVNGTFDGAVQSAPLAQAFLTPITTTATGADVFPTKLDVGTRTTFTINGTGAAGYPYTGDILPGLNASPITAPCSGAPLNGGLLALSCTATMAYQAAGLATPTAVLTNGYSASATVTYPSIAIAPLLGFFVSPQPDLAYAGSPTTITVSVATGTGTLPYGRACDWPGNGNLTCEAGGPTWSFTARYGLAGNYVGHVTVADAGGANVSLVTTATVALAPSLAPFPQTNGTIPMGRPFTLSSVYLGGALPATYWWNESVAGAPGVNTLATGGLLQDGAMDLSWVPTETGRHFVTLVVVDGLGTVKTVLFNTTVAAGPAARIEATQVGASWTAQAGHPYNVSWIGVDAQGYPTQTGLGAVTLSVVAGSSGSIGWLNASVGGPVAPAGTEQSYLLAASDWRDGWLNFSIDGVRAGTIDLIATSTVPVVAASNGSATLVVTPDLAHVELTDPYPVDPAAAYGPNDTCWRIADRFGNPIETGSVDVLTDFGGATTNQTSRVMAGAAEVWVNFTVPLGVGGTVRVVSEWTSGLLWSASWPGAGSVGWVDYVLPLGLLALAVVSLGVAVTGRRRPAAPAEAERPSNPPDDDEPLLRLARGRAHVLARADPNEPRDLAMLARGWTGRPPDPAELTEWVSSLVAEGTLRASVGADGTPRFVRAPHGSAPPTEAPPRIEIDAAALEAALARRPEPEGSPDADDPAHGPSD